jgi:hypothetical protein
LAAVYKEFGHAPANGRREIAETIKIIRTRSRQDQAFWSTTLLFQIDETLDEMREIGFSAQKSGHKKLRLPNDRMDVMIRRNRLPQGKGVRKSQPASEPVPPSDRNGGQVGVSSAEKNDLARALINEKQFSLSIQTTWLCGSPMH